MRFGIAYTSKSMLSALCGSSASFSSLCSLSDTLAPSGISMNVLTTCIGCGSAYRENIQILANANAVRCGTLFLPSSDSLLGGLCFDFLLFLLFFDDLFLPDAWYCSSKYLSERLVAIGNETNKWT